MTRIAGEKITILATNGNPVTARSPGAIDNLVAAMIDMVENGAAHRSAVE